jgi:mono/diheme cytochrome c family protein
MRLAIAALALAAFTTCAGVQLPKESLSDPGALLFNGYVDDKVDCWNCHNGNGQGAGRGPNLANRVPKKSDERIHKVIKEGSGFMPAFRNLSEEQVTQLISWLRTTFPQQTK